MPQSRKEIIVPNDGSRVLYNLSEFGIPEINYLAAQHLPDSVPPLGMHTHPGMMEIAYLVKGERRYTVIGDKDYVVTGNDVFVTYPGELHGSGGLPHGRGLMYWIHLRLPKAGHPFLGMAGTSTRQLVETLRALPQRCFPGSPRLGNMFREVLRICMSGQSEMAGLRLKVLLLQWLVEVADCARSAKRVRLTPDIKRVMAFVRREILRNPPIEELAETAHLSPSRLQGKFKEQTGMAPGEFVKRTRMELSKRMLGQGGRNITQIAYDLGYCTSQHFSDTFKRYYGYSPKQFIQSVHETEKAAAEARPRRLHPRGERNFIHGYYVDPE